MTAKTGSDVVLIWDAAPVVADIVQNETPDEDGLKIVEADGIDIILTKQKLFPKASTISVKIVYPKSQFGPPKYGLQNAELDEVILTEGASRADLIRFGSTWHSQLANGTRPPQITIQIVGAFPSQH